MPMAKTTPLLKRKRPQRTLTSLHLPFDLVEEILCRLPVKHLIQLRCVCKSWNTLISQDSKFAKKHLRLSTSSHNRHHLIRIPYQYLKELVVCHSPISSIFTSASTTRRVKQFSYSVEEIRNEEAHVHRASSCDGIICFRVNECLAVLCNPSIRKFKMLPPLIFLDSFTLVYDRFTNNYKVIAINTSRKKEVHVHTLGTDYWRRIPDFPGSNLIPVPRSGIFLNDSVNWVACDDSGFASCVVSLDLENESCQKLSLPAFNSNVQFKAIFLTLETLRGCLSLLHERGDCSHVWIMKEYGNENSWTKLLTVPHTAVTGFFGYFRALYISEDDQVLMQSSGKNRLVVYNSINNTFKIPKFQNNIYGEMVTQEVYVESLISPL